MAQYLQIGKIAATFGLKGEVVLLHQLGTNPHWENVPALFIEKNKNNFIPYFIESIHPKSATEALVKFESIESKETAGRLLKKGVYLEKALFQEQITPESHLFYLGFTLYDRKEKELGEIAELIDLPEQLLAKVFQEGNELLIPLTEQTIERIDRDQKVIYVALPEGLLDIYRS